jgi:hypothetical protein
MPATRTWYILNETVFLEVSLRNHDNNHLSLQAKIALNAALTIEHRSKQYAIQTIVILQFLFGGKPGRM